VAAVQLPGSISVEMKSQRFIYSPTVNTSSAYQIKDSATRGTMNNVL